MAKSEAVDGIESVPAHLKGNPVGANGIKVLVSISRRDTSLNPFIPQFFDAVSEHVIAIPFGWRTAFFGRYDVFHVHWPDHLFVGRNLWLALIKPIFFLLLLLRTRILGVPVVWTVHNLKPHRSMNIAGRVCYRIFRKSVASVVLMNASDDVLPNVPSVIIPHAHYRDWPVPPAKPNVVSACTYLYFGTISEYKNVESLVREFRNLPDLGHSLVIVGACEDPGLRRGILAEVRKDSRVSANLEFVADNLLWAQIAACRVVVLPYSEMYNSGSAVLALSLNKPILVPDSGANRELRQEIGERWVHTYTGKLTAESLNSAFESVRSLSGVANLSLRSWARIGALYADAYRSVLAAESGR